MLPSPLSIHMGFEKQQQANIDFTIDWSIIKESPYKLRRLIHWYWRNYTAEQKIRISNCKLSSREQILCMQPITSSIPQLALLIYIYIPNIATNRRNPFMIIFLIAIKLKNYDYILSSLYIADWKSRSLISRLNNPIHTVTGINSNFGLINRKDNVLSYIKVPI